MLTLASSRERLDYEKRRGSVYRKALPLEVAIGELRDTAGTQFAPDVVDG